MAIEARLLLAVADQLFSRLLLTNIVAKVLEERPGQGNSAIIESEWPVL